ncbi:MAG: DNA-binding protein [Thermodesulfovibrio sp.]|nr:DNA-binding protein [Thermodesulfovibrio sp.]
MKKCSTKMLLAGSVIALCLVTAQTGFAAKKEPAKKAPKTQEQPETAAISGKVVQTMNSGGYTYVEIENKGKKIWVAIGETKIKKGETVSFKPGAVMENFESKTLKRKFDRIIFSDGLATPQAAGAEAKPTGSKDKVVASKEKIKIDKPAVANAYTVEELYKKRATLNHKTVTVKGKVVKVSTGIMQRNWVHIQDGTGDAAKGTHNLVVTSTAETVPSKGDTLTATGTFFNDKDFGAGYKYDAIIENATFAK